MTDDIERKFLLIRDRANCRNEGTDTFFVEQGASVKNAMKFCWGSWDKYGAMTFSPCPIRKECLEYALVVDYYLQGIWGGTTRRTREAIKSNIFHGKSYEDLEHRYDPRWPK